MIRRSTVNIGGIKRNLIQGNLNLAHFFLSPYSTQQPPQQHGQRPVRRPLMAPPPAMAPPLLSSAGGGAPRARLMPCRCGCWQEHRPHRRGVRSTPLLHSWPTLMSLRFLGTASSSAVRRDVGAPPVSAPCGSHGADGTSAARLAAAPSFFFVQPWEPLTPWILWCAAAGASVPRAISWRCTTRAPGSTFYLEETGRLRGAFLMP